MISLQSTFAATDAKKSNGPAANLPTAQPTRQPTKPTEEPLAIVSRVVGEVGSRVVTSREVSLSEAVGQTLSGLPSDSNAASGESDTKARRVVSINDPGFSGQLVRVMDEWTVYFEAKDIDAHKIDKAEAAKWLKVVQDSWKGVSSFEKLEFSQTEIREAIERKLVVQSFERLKSDTSLVNITDAEALQYYKKNRLRFGNLPFESFKDNIKAALVKTQTERRLLEWRAVLRRKYRVRNLLGT